MAEDLLLNVGPSAVTPGERTPIVVHLINRTAGPLPVSLAVVGLESGWFECPSRPLVLEANEVRDVELSITLPSSYPAASIPIAIVATTDRAQIRTPVTLSVGGLRTLAVRLEPSEIDGTHVGRFTLAIRNRGSELERYRLRAASPIDEVSIRLDESAVVIQPGEERVVAGTITTPRRLSGPRRRSPFSVTVQGRGRPVEVAGGFTSRPELGTRTAKAAVLLAALAVWAAIASIGISALQSALHRHAEAAQTVTNPPTPSSHSTKPPRSSSPGSSSQSSSSPPTSQLVSTTTTATVTGTVAGPAPGGVTITASPQSAPASDPSSFAAPGVFYGTAYVAPAAFSTPATLTTTTAPDGAYVLAGLAPGVRYVVTFAKAGFQTRTIEVGPVSAGAQSTLNIHLLPGTGTLSGETLTAAGPLGGATVTVSNGQVTYTTHTVSTGTNPGTWTIDHVATPGNYLITASAPGYGTQVETVTLPPSGSRSGLDLTLTPNVATISGSVTSATSNTPLGGVSVTATNGSTTVQASTLTVGAVGSFVLPDLAMPHHWTLSFSAPGYETEAETVDLTSNATINLVLPQAGADLVGTITMPSTTPASATTTIGLTLSNGSTTYKTLSTSRTPGSDNVSYQFPQIPPGTYVLAAEGFGFLPTSTSVTLSAGATTTSNLTLQLSPPNASFTGSITGSVVATSGVALADVPMTLSINGTTTTTTTNTAGTYTFTNVPPGVATISADGTSITQTNTNGFTTTSEQVLVATGAAVDAPTIALSPLGSISVTLLSSTGQQLSAPPGCTSSIALSASLAEAGVSVPITPTEKGALFTFSGVAPGTYVVTGSATCYIAATSSVTIASGQNVALTLELSSVPTYAILVEQLQPSGGNSFTPAPVNGACVTLTNGSASQTSITNSSGLATFGNLDQGTSYAVSVDEYASPPTNCPGAGNPSATATTTFTAEANGTDQTVLVSPVLSNFSVSLSYPFVDAASPTNGSIVDCPIVQPTSSTACPALTSLTASDVQMTLTGVTSNQTSPTSGQTQTQTFDPISSTNGVWTFSSSELAPLVSTSATLTIAVPGFQAFTASVTLPTAASSSTTVNELLTPNPVPVTVSGPTNLANFTVTPSALVPQATNTLTTSTTIGINVSTNSTGQPVFVWTDPATGHASGYAEPGIYDISATGSGVEVPSTEASITPCTQASCTPETVSLTDNTLTISPTNLPSGVTTTATLWCVGTASLTQIGTPIAFASTSVTFSGLSPSTLVTNATTSACSTFTYSIDIGTTQTYVSTNELVTTSSGPSTTTRTPTLTYLDGKLLGQAYASGPTVALGGTSLSVCVVDTTSCSAADTLTTTTQTDGTFLVPSTATASVSNGSITVTNSLAGNTGYPVSISSTAYTLAPQTVTADVFTTLLATANPITQTIVVTTGTTAASVTVTPETTSGAPAVSSQTDTTTCQTSSGTTTCSYSFTFSLQPAQWTFQATATNFTTGFAGPVSYEAGASPAPLSITISQPTTTVSGTVYVADSATDTSSTPIGCLTLALENNSSTVQTTTTAPTSGETCPAGSPSSSTTSPGTYTFTGVTAGTYTIVVTSPGYNEQQPVSFATSIPNPTLDNFTVYANDVPLTVTLTSSTGVSASDLTGATVTLTPTTTALSATCSSGSPLLGLPSTASQSATVVTTSSGSNEASFASVPPDAYQIDVSGSNVPTQPSPLPTVVVCPSEQGATTSAAVDQGAVSGTITVTAKTAPTTSTQVTVTIEATAPSNASVTPTTVQTTCTATINAGATSGSCTYTLEWLAFGTQYTISTSPAATSPSTNPTFTPSSTTPTTTENFTVPAS